MNIVIPMGGIGSRFSKHGYRLPKPLIKIAGRPMLLWILDNLHFQSNDTLFLAIRPSMEEGFGLSQFLREKFPFLEIVTVTLDFETRGAAETLYVVTQHMDDHQLERRTISLDCDTIYFSDALSPFRSLPVESGCSLYFNDNGSQPIYSYISFTDGNCGTSETKTISAITEKVRISSHANTGGYGFASAFLLQQYLEQALEHGVPSSGEYYTSTVIERMVRDGHEFRGIYIEDFSCVGTVPQLLHFLQVLRTSRQDLSPKLTFSFSLQGTSVVSDVYKKSNLSTDNDALARSLANAGHVVIIRAPNVDAFTHSVVRSMKIKQAKPRQNLRGSPCADIHISASSLDGLGDLESELGWQCG